MQQPEKRIIRSRSIPDTKELPMEKFLKDYIEHVRPVFGRIPEQTAHVIASAFFSFKFEL